LPRGFEKNQVKTDNPKTESNNAIQVTMTFSTLLSHMAMY